MSEPAGAAPTYLCRLALEQIAMAETCDMAAWMHQRADGSTMKQAFIEAARLVMELERRFGTPHSVRFQPLWVTEAGNRERRPVLMLTRELQESLSRLQEHLEHARSPDLIGAREALVQILTLLHPPSPTEDRRSTMVT